MSQVKEFAFYFLIYAFGGWLLENIYSLVRDGIFFKPNFLKSPIKPMYGIAPILLIYTTSQNSHWLVIISLGLIIPTAVEYVTGVFLEKYSGKKWWDYSELVGQVHGRICVGFSFCWIFLSLGLIYFLHPFIFSIYQHYSSAINWIIPFLIIFVIIDMLISTFFQKAEGFVLNKH